MFESAIGTALGFIFLFGYIGWKKVAGYAVFVDVAVFCLCIYLFQGTYAGMMTGIIASLMISVFLKTVRRTVGAERIHVKFTGMRGLPKCSWRDIAPH